MNLEIDQYTENANKVKDHVLDKLFKDQVITLEEHELYTTKWQIIVFKYGWFKRWFKKHSADTKETDWGYRFVQIED
jgi:hypothetical protein